MTTISNQAHVTFSYEGARDVQTNDSNIVSHQVRDRLCFTVEKTSSVDCFKAGDSIIYFLHITNCGCQCIGRFEICDNLGDITNVTYVPNSARIFVNGSMKPLVPESTSPLHFDVNERLERNGELLIQYTVLVGQNISSEITSITNEVEVKGYGCNCEERNGEYATECTSHTINICKYAEVLITKEASSTNVCCGEEMDYFITLTNTGNVDATNVVVTDSLPTNFNLLEIHKENNGNHYQYNAGEYDLDANNFLTLPNATGTIIEVPAIGPGVDNTTRIRIHGTM